PMSRPPRGSTPNSLPSPANARRRRWARHQAAGGSLFCAYPVAFSAFSGQGGTPRLKANPKTAACPAMGGSAPALPEIACERTDLMSGVNEIRSAFLDYFAKNGHE